MSMSEIKFTIGENRERPPYLSKTLRCPSCNAPISMYSEQSQLVVCESCGQNLDCSTEDLVALGKTRTVDKFLFQVHQTCNWKGVKYKVIGRILLLDEWDGHYAEYLLFHPFHGTRWLSIYTGEEGTDCSFSEPIHALSKDRPFSSSKGDKIATEDGQKWKFEERTVLQVSYVDGALPWLVRAGDVQTAADFVNTKDRKSYLTVEESHFIDEKTGEESKELEYSFSKEATMSSVNRAFGITGKKLKLSSGSASTLPNAFRLFLMGLSALVAMYFVVLCFSTGKQNIASFTFTPADLSEETLSPSFYVDQKDLKKAFELGYGAGVDNSWMSLNIGIVSTPEATGSIESYQQVLLNEEGLAEGQQTRLRHLSAVDISYYHGYEGGESWSEGATSETELLMFPEAGHYRILLQGVSGVDETPMQFSNTSVTVKVYKNANAIRYYILMVVFSVLIFAMLREWK